MGVDSRLVFTLLMVLVAVQRLWELQMSSRNRDLLLAEGAVEAGARHYPWMVALHTLLLVAAPAEVWLLDRPVIPWLAAASLGGVIGANVVRLWVMQILGWRWTTRVLYLPGTAPVTGGPFRWLRHPNYMAVIVELAALPLVHTAWLTALVVSVLNLVLLRVRIRVEDQALAGAVTARRDGGFAATAPAPVGERS